MFGQKLPAGHCTPFTVLVFAKQKYPAEQLIGAATPAKQYEPAGQLVGYELAFGQKVPAEHCTPFTALVFATQ